MKRLLLTMALLLAPLSLQAQDPPDPTTAPAAAATAETPTAAPATPAPSTPSSATADKPEGTADPTDGQPHDDVGGLITDAGKVIDDWKNVGWLAGVIALINLLLNLLRFRPIDEWLTRIDYKWIKPLVATVLGAALGGFSTFATGASVLNSIVAGAMAGLGSVGFHELMSQTRKRGGSKPTADPPAAQG